MQNLKHKFAKTVKYREFLGLEKPYENRLIFEDLNRIEKSKEIHRISQEENGLKCFLLTILPVNPKQQRGTTKYLASKGVPYFGTIEFTDKNAPHLHLTIYLKTIKQSLEIQKSLYKKLKIIKPRKKKGKERVEPIHIQLMKEKFDEKGNSNTPQFYSIKELNYEVEQLKEIRDDRKTFSMKQYFKQKALLKYFNFTRKFLSSKIPTKYVNPRIEKGKLEKRIEKLEKIGNMDGEKFTIEIEDFPKEEQTKIKKYLSSRKVKYFTEVGIERTVKTFKMIINIKKDWMKNLFDFVPREISKIESVVKKLGLKMKVLKESVKNWIQKMKKEIRLFQKKDMLFIKRFSEKANKFKKVINKILTTKKENFSSSLKQVQDIPIKRETGTYTILNKREQPVS
jgi:hypothetical protein